LDIGVNQAPPLPAPQMTILPINKRAVFLKTVSVKDLDNIDPAPYDDADFYAKIEINNQRFIESCQNGRDNLSPPWITMKFVDAGIPVVAIHYEVWDEDTTSDDDRLDIERRNGLPHLDFLYNMNTHRSGGIGIDGVFDRPSRLLVSRGTPGDHAEVKMYITTRTLGPAPRRFGELSPDFDAPKETAPAPGTPSNPDLPDLQITSFSVTQFTVKNAGAAPAGPFVVSIGRTRVFPFPGLAAGASATQRTVTSACSFGRKLVATADAQNQVTESNETNNTRSC
jgi:hypothetical protein